MIREMWYIKALRGDYRDQGWKPYVGMDQEEMGGNWKDELFLSITMRDVVAL